MKRQALELPESARIRRTAPYRVVGLDLSLTCTGWADGRQNYGTIQTELRGMERIRHVWKAVRRVVDDPFLPRPRLVMIEGYSFASKNSHAHGAGELGGVIRFWLHVEGIPYIEIPPSTLKMFATGSGNAGKGLVLVDAVKRLGYSGSSDDEADALWLRELGLYLVGDERLGLPKTHTRALAKVKLPEALR